MVVLSIVLMVFSEPLAALVAPGFHQVKQLRVAEFMRVMFLAQILLAISLIYGSVLQSLKKFLLYALAPIFYNIGIIIGAMGLVDFIGPMGLAWGWCWEPLFTWLSRSLACGKRVSISMVT